MSCKPTTLASKYAYMTLQNNDVAFQQGIVSFDVLFRQENPADYYDRTELLTTTSGINILKSLPALAGYEMIYDRLQQGNMTYIEVADFLQQSGYTPSDVQSILSIFPFVTTNTRVDALLNQLDFYFTENVGSSVNGGTCGAIINPFLKALDILDKLKDFDIGSLFGPLAAIKAVIEGIVDKLKDTLMQQVDNLVGKIAGQISKVKEMGVQVLSQFRKMVENVRSFLSDVSIEGIKAKVGEFLAKASGQFETLTPDAIALLLFRFCQFSEMVQSFMQAPIKALQERVSTFEDTTANLESDSLRTTEEVVANGARRVVPAEIANSRGRLIDLANRSSGGGSSGSRSTGGGTGTLDLRDTGTPAAASGLQIPSYVESGAITEQQATAILNMNDSGIPGYCTFTDGVWNMHLKRGRLTDAGPGDGYKRVKDEVWVKLIKALDMIPDLKPVRIESAYRSRQYNKKLNGSAKSSKHTSGQALDVRFPSGGRYEAVARFIAACSIQGFGAIQTYPENSFTHIDLAGKRNWTGYGADGTSGRWGSIIRAHNAGNVSSLTNMVRTEGGEQTTPTTELPENDPQTTDPQTTDPNGINEETIYLSETGEVLNPEADPVFAALNEDYLARARRVTGRT